MHYLRGILKGYILGFQGYNEDPTPKNDEKGSTKPGYPWKMIYFSHPCYNSVQSREQPDIKDFYPTGF